MLDGNGTYEVKFENGGSEKGVAKDRIVKAASIMANLQIIQKAIDAGKVEGWTTQINATAKRVSMKVKEMAEKEEEWMSEGALPEECIVEGTIVEERLAAVVVRETLRALQRRPTRRSVIYDMFFKVYLDREIRKSLGKSGGVAPDELEFEASEFSRQLALYMTKKNTTKLSQKVRSKLFTDPSDVSLAK